MSCADVYANVQKRKLLSKTDVAFGYISWQSFLKELHSIKLNNHFYRVIINDLIDLLDIKGFEQFDSMDLKDDYLVDAQKYFKFNYRQKKKFDLTVNTNIEGDFYYEFK